MKKAASLLLLILLGVRAFAQPDFRFHRYGLSDGLPSPEVHAIAEDRYGQLWFGTANGLASFNGYNFTVFRNAGGSQPELTSNDITTIFPLASGDLLIGTTAGLHVFDHRKQVFRNLWGTLPHSYISTIIADPKGGFWIGSSTGLYYSAASDKMPESYIKREQSPLYNTGIFGMHLDAENRLWITTSRKGFFKLIPGTQTIINYRNNPADPASLSSDVMRQIIALPDGRLAVGTADAGYNIFDPRTEKFERFNHDPADPTSLSSTSAFSLLLDSKNNLWIGTWANGLNMIDTQTWRGRYFKNNPDNPYSVCSNSITTLFESSTHDIWIGSGSGGLSRLTPADQLFDRYRHDSATPNSLTASYVRSIQEATDSSIWFGTNQGGLNRYNPTTGVYTVYLKPDGSRESLSRGTIWSMSESPAGNLWFGTSRGVGEWNRKTDQISFLAYDSEKDDPKKLSGNNVLKVLDDQHGNLWVGIYYGGLNRVDVNTRLIEKYRHNDQDPLSLSGDDVNDIFLDEANRLWVACDNGLNLFDEKTKTFKHFFNEEDAPTLVHINEGKNGVLYLGTSQGLAIFNPDNNTVQYVGEAEGLGADHVNSVLPDDAGFIWLGTNNGIDRYNPLTKEVLHLNEQHGLTTNDTEGKSCFASKRGKLYFGGIDGVTAFNPKDLFSDHRPSRVMFTGLSVFNKPSIVNDTSLLHSSIYTTDTITLNYSDYVFALEFAALRFDIPADIRYSYILEGFDKSWLYAGANDRKAVYTNVPHGTYTLKVKASDVQGRFDDNFIKMIIVITPPWWKTWWAYVLLYGSIFLVVLLVVRGRIAFIKQQNRLLGKQVAERTAEVQHQKEKLEMQAATLEKSNLQKSKLFSIIAHDLKSPLNSLQALITLMDPKIITSDELDTMKKEVGKRVESMSDVMSNLLTWASSQLEEERLMFKSVDPGIIIQEMIELYTPIAAKKNIRLYTTLQHQSPVRADVNMLRAILRNLTNNAIKFTPAGGEVILSTRETQYELIIMVKDSGVGMDAARIEKLFTDHTISTIGTGGERGIGLGLQLVHDFVVKQKGRVWAESKPGEGSAFLFTLPKDRN